MSNWSLSEKAQKQLRIYCMLERYTLFFWRIYTYKCINIYIHKVLRKSVYQYSKSSSESNSRQTRESESQIRQTIFGSIDQ